MKGLHAKNARNGPRRQNSSCLASRTPWDLGISGDSHTFAIKTEEVNRKSGSIQHK